MAERREIHERVLNAKNSKELNDVYGEWAESYDSDLVTEMGYVAHSLCADLLSKNVNAKDSLILDAGCGTGLVGQELSQKGFQAIDGLDYSEDMLQQAAKKNVYQSLNQGDLNGKLDIPDNTYQAVICVGTLTLGHVGPNALKELARITKPEGIICFSVREQAWDQDDYESDLGAMVNSGMWQCKKQFESDYIQQEGSKCMICLYQVCN